MIFIMKPSPPNEEGYPIVQITTPGNDLDVFEAAEVMRDLLLAWGYQEKNVIDVMGERT